MPKKKNSRSSSLRKAKEHLNIAEMIVLTALSSAALSSISFRPPLTTCDWGLTIAPTCELRGLLWK